MDDPSEVSWESVKPWTMLKSITTGYTREVTWRSGSNSVTPAQHAELHELGA
jgi:hypothetical protein